MSLLDDMERLFLHTEFSVVAAFPVSYSCSWWCFSIPISLEHPTAPMFSTQTFPGYGYLNVYGYCSHKTLKMRLLQVLKCEPSVRAKGAKSKFKFKCPRVAPHSKRVLCFTVQRRSGHSGYKASMHVCKGGASGEYEIRKAYRLKLFAKVETFEGCEGVFELTMAHRGLTGNEVRIAYAAPNNASRDDLVDVLTSLCSTHEKHTLNVDRVESREAGDLDLPVKVSGAVSLQSTLLPEIDATNSNPKLKSGSDLTTLLTTPPAINANLTQASSSPASMISRKGIQSVTDSKIGYALVETVSQSSTTSLEDVRQKLLTELSALNDASVHELLECEDSVANMETELRTTLGFLDDLEETVSIFDSKLHFVRDYMSVIDEKMNQLELRSRGNAEVLDALGGIVKELSLGPDTESALRRGNWESGAEGVLSAVGAARDLHRAIVHVTTPGSIPPPFDTLSAVVTRRRYLLELSKSFLDRATNFLSRSYDHIADDLEPATKKDNSKPAFGETIKFEKLHARARHLKPLLLCVVQGRPHAGSHLRLQYCRSLNALLRREIALASTEMVSSAGSISAGEGINSQSLKSSSSSIATMSSAHSSRYIFESKEPELMTKTMQKSEVALALERIHSTPQQLSFSRMASSREASPKTSPRSMRRIITEMTPGRARHRHRSAGSGSELNIPPDVVFSQFMKTFLPLLACELERCFDVMGLSEMSSSEEYEERERLKGEVLKSIQEAIDGMVERLLLPPHGRILGSVSMIGTCVHWQTVSYSKDDYAAATKETTKEIAEWCERKIKSIWRAYLDEKVASITKFDGTSSLGMRTIHILPFIASFQAVATRLESSYEEWVTLSRTSVTTRSVAESPLIPLKPSPFEQTILSTDEREQAEEQATRSPAAEVRALIDQFYARILPCILRAIEDQAVESKHGTRIRLENYALLRLELQNPALLRVGSLEKIGKEVGKRRNAALTVFVEQQIAALGPGMTPLVQLGFQLAELAASGLSPSEAATRVPWTEDSLRSAMNAVSVGLDKQLRSVRMGLIKSLGESSLYLVDVVWEKLKQRVLESWSELEHRLPVAFGLSQQKPQEGRLMLTTEQMRNALMIVTEAVPIKPALS